MLSILCVLAFSGKPALIPNESLEFGEFYKLNSSFVTDSAVYLCAEGRIGKFSLNGEVLAVYNENGAGPGEISHAVGIFIFGTEIWCRDALQRKVVILDEELKFVASRKDKQACDYAPNDDNWAKIVSLDSVDGIFLDLWNHKTNTSKKVQIAGYEGPNWPLPNAFPFGNHEYAIASFPQKSEKYSILVTNISAGTHRRIIAYTPGWTPESEKESNPFLGTALRSIFADKKHIVVVLEHLEAAKGRKPYILRSWLHVFDRKTLNPLETKEMEGVFLMTEGPTSHLLYQTENGVESVFDFDAG